MVWNEEEKNEVEGNEWREVVRTGGDILEEVDCGEDEYG